jgi:predicted TIM-barrel fold metal-dependent hydrolase
MTPSHVGADLGAANFADLEDLYFRETGAPTAIAEFNRIRNGTSQRELSVLLRDHTCRDITSTAEVQLRDAFDDLIACYGIMEIACTLGYVGELPEPFVRTARRVLDDGDVRAYYEVHYPLLLPQLFRRRVAGERTFVLPADAVDLPALMRFFDLSAAVESSIETEHFLGMLDGYVYGNEETEYGLGDLFAVLRRPDVLARRLARSERQRNALDLAVLGFRRYLRFCRGLDELLAGLAHSPVQQSLLWHHHAYWFECVRDEAGEHLHHALRQLAHWEAPPTTGAGADAEVAAPEGEASNDEENDTATRDTVADAPDSSTRTLASMHAVVRRLTSGRYGWALREAPDVSPGLAPDVASASESPPESAPAPAEMTGAVAADGAGNTPGRRLTRHSARRPSVGSTADTESDAGTSGDDVNSEAKEGGPSTTGDADTDAAAAERATPETATRSRAAAVDMHTHVFNLRSLPVRGILERRGLAPLLARAVAAIFLAMVEDDAADGDRREAVGRADLREPAVDASGRTAHQRRHAATNGAAAPVLRSRVIAVVADTAPATVFLDPAVAAAVDAMEEAELRDALGPERRERLARARSGGEARGVAYSVALGLSQADKDERRRVLVRLLDRAAGAMVNGLGMLQFLHLLTRSERHIVACYRELYPDVGLAVHHMMDLAPHYGGDEPAYAYPTVQVRRILDLVNSSGGRLLAFAAWNPYRDNCREAIAYALNAGCVGVKFYPPSGYQAVRNPDGLPGAPAGRELDARNRWLFAECVARDVPLFTHCTPGGFEAHPGYGRFSDPAHWREALVEFPTLRLGFGHAGGGEGWFAPLDDEGPVFPESFAERAVALALEFPNVYCEFGYLDEVLDAGQLAFLQRRLRRLLTASPSFASRMLYGSDWHMLYQEAESEAYLRAFERVFTGTLAVYATAFFETNARQFLNLRAFAERTRGLFSHGASTHLLELSAG